MYTGNQTKLNTKENQVGGQVNAAGMQNASTAFNVRDYSNTHAFTGAGTGSYDFNTMSDLTGSGGGGGYDESLQLDSGIPLTKRNPMLRKNVVGYHSGGRVNPYKYAYGGKRPSYSQGGMSPQQESNDGAVWANMAARLGQKNADIALLQTQKIVQGNGRGNPYQMPDQRNMMPNAKYNNGGQVGMASQNMTMDNLVSDAYKEMFPPMAQYGMKRKYQEGGNYPHDMYHPETGYKIVAKDEAMHTKLADQGFGHTPKAAYGMKRKYTDGGGFNPFQTTNGEGPYVGHKPGSSAYKAYVKQGVIPTGETDFNTHTGQYIKRSAMKRKYTQGGRF